MNETLPEGIMVDLIRHGEPEGGRRFRGSLDDPLSELGWKQMEQSVVGHDPWDLIVTSPLRRCADFARTLGDRTAIEVQSEERLREIGFGDWEGRQWTEMLQEDPEGVRGFWRDPVRNPPPEGEPLLAFRERVTEAWEDLQRRHQGRHLLMVAHGGVIRMIIGEVLGLPLNNLFRIEVPFAGLSRICVEGGVPRLVFHVACAGQP